MLLPDTYLFGVFISPVCVSAELHLQRHLPQPLNALSCTVRLIHLLSIPVSLLSSICNIRLVGFVRANTSSVEYKISSDSWLHIAQATQ